MSRHFTLYYDRIQVAKVQEGALCERTWDGTYELTLCTQTELEYRIMELIPFCQDWHERNEKNRTSPPSATEFDQYNDLILSDLWQMRSSDRPVWSRLEGAPVFPTERLICWKYSQTLKPKPVDLARITPSCLTLTVKALAQAIYKDQRFQDMPILADALEDAGCTNANILNHCRQPGEHAPGCWVLELLLGK